MAITLANFGPELYKQAHEKGMTLSMFLELESPTQAGEGLDAFERLMKEAGILTKSIPGKNLSSSKVEAFYRTDTSPLFPEYVARTLVHAMTEYPMYQHLVATRTGITGGVYEASYLDFGDAKNKKALEMRRVTEASDLPKATLKLGESAIKLYKYGRAVGVSYEALRRMNLEVFERHIAKIGTEAANNKIAEILTVIKDGDGNNNAADVIKQTDLGATAGDKLNREVLVKFLLKFYTAGGCNTVVANEDGFLQVLNVLYPTADVAGMADEAITKGLNVSVQMPQNLVTNFTLLYNPNIGKVDNKEVIYGLNKDTAIEEVYELSSTINEADINVINQTKAMTVSENSGFRKMFKDSSLLLKLD